MTGVSDKPEGLPRRLGRYVLLKRLHGGGMTEVYAARLAEEVGPSRLLVIKILPGSAEGDHAGEARFLEEARIVLNFTHGNITAAFEFGREGGRPFLVMEYVPGPSLRSLLDSVSKSGGLLEVQDALFIVREVARALGYAHSFSDGAQGHGIVHRDVSPDNILISTAGQVKLTDFGISEYLSSGFQGPLWGKAEYIAPEVIIGEPPSPASDIYSLGAVLYECLTGAPPLRGGSHEETLTLKQTSAPAPPSKSRPDLPEELDRLVLRLLSKDPGDRPSTAAELEVEIRSVLADTQLTYSESALAETVSEHLPAEDYLAPSVGDSMRAGMLRAGVDLRGAETTGELIATGTVPLPGPAGSTKKQRLSRRLIMSGAISLVALAALALLALGQGSETPTASPARVHGSRHSVPERTSVAEQDPPPRRETATPVVEQPPVGDGESAGPSRDTARKTHTKRRQKIVLAPQRAADKVEKKPPDQDKEWGWLNINSSPWSYVSVDGRKLNGHTPYRRIKLERGKHTLLFENAELGLRARREVEVKAWVETNIGVRLE